MKRRQFLENTLASTVAAGMLSSVRSLYGAMPFSADPVADPPQQSLLVHRRIPDLQQEPLELGQHIGRQLQPDLQSPGV